MTHGVRLVCFVLAFFSTAGMSIAAPAVTVSPSVGPPASRTTVRGTGFGAFTAIDVYYDTSHLCLTFATSTGAASCTITVPRTAQPLYHWVSMLQRNNSLGAQKSHLVRTDFAQFHGQTAAHSGRNATENTISAANVADLDILWTAALGPGGTQGSAIVHQGRVFVTGAEGKLYAFNADTGVAVAGFPKILGGVVHSSPAASANRVFVATSTPDNKLYGFDATSGATLPGFPVLLPSTVYSSSPAIALGNVYIGGYSGKLSAYNVTNGSAVAGFPVTMSAYQLEGSPSIANGRVFIGSADDYVYSVNALTGAAIPGFPYWSGSDLSGTVAIAGNSGFFGSTGYKLDSFDAENGRTNIGFPFTTSLYIYGSPAVTGNRVFLGNSEGRVYAINLTGGLIWSNLLGGGAYGINASPLVANGIVFINTWLKLYALSAATGEILWSTPVYTGGFLNSVAIANGIAYLGSSDGRFYAFSVNGESVSARRLGGALGIKPALSSLRPDPELEPR